MGCQLAAQRLGSKILEERVRGPGRFRHEQHEAEPAGVIVDHAGAGRSIDLDVIVAYVGATRENVFTQRCAAAILLDSEPAGHSKMHDEGVAAVKNGNQVLRAPVKPQDSLTSQLVVEPLGKRKPQIRAIGNHPVDTLSNKDRQQPTPYRLNFR